MTEPRIGSRGIKLAQTSASCFRWDTRSAARFVACLVNIRRLDTGRRILLSRASARQRLLTSDGRCGSRVRERGMDRAGRPPLLRLSAGPCSANCRGRRGAVEVVAADIRSGAHLAIVCTGARCRCDRCQRCRWRRSCGRRRGRGAMPNGKHGNCASHSRPAPQPLRGQRSRLKSTSSFSKTIDNTNVWSNSITSRIHAMHPCYQPR